MPIAQTKIPITPELYWIEPDDFPAWRRRVDLERLAGHLTLHRREALNALVDLWRPGEPFQPTDAEIAAEAKVCARTVRRARQDARELGLLEWQRTRQLVNGRWRQGRNEYLVKVPTTPVCPDGQGCRARKEDKKERGLGRSAAQQIALLGVGAPTPKDALAALAARRAVIEARLAAGTLR